METEIITIKQVPAELKLFWVEQARQNGRSTNKELIRLLELERQRILLVEPRKKNKDSIRQTIQAMQHLTALDDRPINEILYDENGMPK